MLRAILIIFLISIISPAFSQSDLGSLFVDQDWLIKNSDREDLVILHVGTEEDYNTGHLDGAYLITPADFSTTTNNLRWELPNRQDFSKALAERGIGRETINILYFGNETFAPAFRLYFTMKYFGISNNTYILDGGLPGWYSKNRPTTSTKVPLLKDYNNLYLFSNSGLLATKDDVMRASKDSLSSIIDARRESYFTGEVDGDGYYKRSGHIPNAINITWLDLFDSNKFIKSESELRKYFDKVGEKNSVITYCHVGLRASVLYSLASALGFDTRLYDGSYNEWDTLSEEYPIQKGH